MIPNCIPDIEGREADYVLEAVGACDLAVGPHIGRFEAAIGAAAGGVHAVAVSTGTAALHLALLASGVGPGDAVVVPATTFAATANAVRYCGAHPVIADVDEVSWGLDVAQVAAYLSRDCEPGPRGPIEKATGRRVAALLPVHVYGHPADMDALNALAASHGMAMVEDGAEALGALYKGRPVGSLSPVTAFSFNGNKIITTAGGGMVVSPDPSVVKRCRYLANQAKDDGLDFHHRETGYNYRMPNVNAAVGLAQAEGLARRVARKRAIAQFYMAGLAGLDGVSVWREAEWATSSYWMPILTMQPGRFSIDGPTLAAEMVAKGAGARPVWCPLDRQPALADCRSLGTRVAERLYRTSVCLPCTASITDEQIAEVVRVAAEVLEDRRA